LTVTYLDPSPPSSHNSAIDRTYDAFSASADETGADLAYEELFESYNKIWKSSEESINNQR